MVDHRYRKNQGAVFSLKLELRRVVKVSPAGTSQHCLCGCEVRKALSERVHRCPECGLNAPRDTVSALLILRLGRSLEALT